MRKNNTIIFYILLCITSVVSSQKLTFKVANDSLLKKIQVTSIDDVVLKSVYDKENKIEVDYLNLDEGYYLLKKDDNAVVLYLKPTDDLTVSFDDENFYKTLTFSGEGSYVNSYLLSKKREFLDKKGRLKKYYKAPFYEGDKEAYLDKLDRLYKDNYGVLFASSLDKKFKEEEMKNLQYGYSLDLLKYQEANKYYKLKDSAAPSRYFLEPLNHIHFQNNQLYQKYNNYKELAILKWKKDIENRPDLRAKQDVFSSIRIKALQVGVLRSLYDDMNRSHPERTKQYYQLIKHNSKDNRFLLKTKEKYALIRHAEAEKNLSKFKFKNSDGELEKLSQFKGKYIFLNIWTTWCKGCLKEFKKLEKLEDKFHDENIAFVSVSVDKPEEFNLWVNMLEENGLKGNQLFLNDSKLKFIKLYDLKEIPSFVILSTKGVPLDFDIKKVASKETEKLIESLFKD